MKLFKTKEEKKQEQKMLVRRSMRAMENRITKLEQQEAVYIREAKIAMRENLPQQVNLARQALKMTVAERKRTYQMLLNARILSQMKDTTEATAEFLSAIRVISKEISGSSYADMASLTNEIRSAMGKVTMQSEQLDDLLDTTNGDMTNAVAETEAISEEDLDRMIYGASGAENDTIDDDLAELRKHLK